MATRKYKFILLKDPDISSHQSRGLSLQVNGFAPVADVRGAIAQTLSGGKVPDITELVADNDVVLLFRDVKYVTNNGVPSAADVNYQNYKSEPGLHMFQGVRTEAADELSYQTEDGSTRSQIVLTFPIYSSMFGDRIQGSVKFQGIVLYGQAYNAEFYDETAQGQLQDAVPIGLIWLESDYELTTTTSESDDASSTMFSAAISLRTGVDITDAYIQSNPEYAEAYKEFQGHFHVVNNNMTTSSSFVLRGRGVEPMKNVIDEGNPSTPLPDGDATIDFSSRVFFTSDPPGNNYDHNVDFGSPARLTIFNAEELCDGTRRIPQTLIGKVSYEEDEDLYKHAFWDGVAESYYQAGYKPSANEKLVDGSVYDIDWISKKKPFISIFSTNNEFVAPGVYSKTDLVDPEKQHHIAYEFTSDTDNGAAFANGTNILSTDSQSVEEGVNVNTLNSKTRGNAMVLNSADVESYTRNISAEEWREKNAVQYKYDTFIANSQRVYVYTEVKGSSNHEDGAKNQLFTVLGSEKVNIQNFFSRSSLPSGKNMILGCTEGLFQEINNTAFFGCDGIRAFNANNSIVLGSTGSLEINSWCEKVLVLGTTGSQIVDCQHTTVIGGEAYVKGLRDSVVITGTEDPEFKNVITKTTANDYIGKNCYVFGVNNQILLDGSDQHNIYIFGKGLNSDPRIFQGNDDDGTERWKDRTPTLLLGIDNSKYYQKNSYKTVVIGGHYFAAGTKVDQFKYNSLEHYVAKTGMTNYKGKTANYNVESIDSMTDVKGRKVKYTSNAIELSFIKGRKQDDYDSYNFKGCGRINLFKLYQLLHRMWWDQSTGVVKFDWDGNQHGGTTNTFLDKKAGWHSWDLNGDTNLANLVDDNMACFPYAPMM